MMWYGPGMAWWMVLLSLFWLVLIGLAVWAFVRWVAHQTRAGGEPPSARTAAGPSALEILRQRYARGEIDSETFERMREQLDASVARDHDRPDVRG
ncbi:MAG TPA: SHOCT domain-containing protein [Ktedonobacterales bacterium]